MLLNSTVHATLFDREDREDHPMFERSMAPSKNMQSHIKG